MRRRARPRRRGDDLLVRVHLLSPLRHRASTCLPELRRRARRTATPRAVTGASHLYLHLPFCSSRCGYCDFVTVVGRFDEHGSYVSALLAELELERNRLATRLATIYLGGGTPTLLQPAELARLLAALPPCDELTVEANPETVTPTVAALLHDAGVDRISLGAQTFQPD